MEGAAMINTVEDIAESRKVDRIAGYASASPVIARPIQISGVLLCLYIFTLLILCSIVSLVTTSNAQELPAPTSNASILANGWWSPKTVESETAPQLRISMAELTHFETSDLLRTCLLQPASYLTVFFLMIRRPPKSTLLTYTTLFR